MRLRAGEGERQRQMTTAWAVCGEGVDEAVLVEAPVVPEGWEGRPWVRLRALTEAEAMERESLGLSEEYEVVSGGLQEPAVRVRRMYDLRVMAAYDHEHCVLDFCLPERQRDGSLFERRMGPEAAAGERAEFLGRMQPALAQWLRTEIERVNRRLPEQRALIETAKKKLRALARQERGLAAGLAEVLEAELPPTAARGREGVDFTGPQEAAALLGGEQLVAAAPAWGLMLMARLRELRLHEATGQLPHGKTYTEQPAWQVELWEAYWQAKGAGTR